MSLAALLAPQATRLPYVINASHHLHVLTPVDTPLLGPHPLLTAPCHALHRPNQSTASLLIPSFSTSHISLGKLRSPALSPSHVCSPHNHHIHTPIHTNHPIYLLRVRIFRNTLTYGFTLGLNISQWHSGHTHRRHSLNLPSAACRPDIITAYLQGKCNWGNTARPFQTSPFLSLVTSPHGVIPRKLHQSFPDGHSINGDFSSRSTMQSIWSQAYVKAHSWPN